MWPPCHPQLTQVPPSSALVSVTELHNQVATPWSLCTALWHLRADHLALSQHLHIYGLFALSYEALG